MFAGPYKGAAGMSSLATPPGREVHGPVSVSDERAGPLGPLPWALSLLSSQHSEPAYRTPNKPFAAFRRPGPSYPAVSVLGI